MNWWRGWTRSWWKDLAIVCDNGSASDFVSEIDIIVLLLLVFWVERKQELGDVVGVQS